MGFVSDLPYVENLPLHPAAVQSQFLLWEVEKARLLERFWSIEV